MACAPVIENDSATQWVMYWVASVEAHAAMVDLFSHTLTGQLDQEFKELRSSVEWLGSAVKDWERIHGCKG